MRGLTKEERRAYIHRRCYELARTGKFSKWIDIEFHLRFEEDLPEARQELDKPYLRKQLDEICEDRRKKDK